MRMMVLALNNVACTGCIRKIKKQIQRTHGIEKVRIVTGTGKIQINFDEQIIQTEDINRSLNKWTLRTFD
ncbi:MULTISPECIES: heavy-metal-associated domain-containing protein [Bacillaceae]|uniref:heavy-metal-associated domain-containing protein n=1 Tax=Bacillaceae TaxID=186817 RepID=UPI00118CF03A|nr:heavy-metal-associated domain-containing protein [Bacillus sp. S3]QCJ41466.1 cation transporter [Bacillus sp. S3]